jgi:hypothetical protein
MDGVKRRAYALFGFLRVISLSPDEIKEWYASGSDHAQDPSPGEGLAIGRTVRRTGVWFWSAVHVGVISVIASSGDMKWTAAARGVGRNFTRANLRNIRTSDQSNACVVFRRDFVVR